MSLSASNSLYTNFLDSFTNLMGNNGNAGIFSFGGLDFSNGSSFVGLSSNSESQGYFSAPSESAYESQAPAELLIYAFPKCFGAAITPAINDRETMELTNQHSEKYHRLEEKKSAAKEAVIEKYGLNNISQEESFQKTHCSESKELTDYYYSQFDQEGQDLIKFFYPAVAEKYNF